LFDNQIQTATTTDEEPNRLQVKVSRNLDNRHVNGPSKNESFSFVITEKELKIILAGDFAILRLYL
jgi:hypothetical protein